MVFASEMMKSQRNNKNQLKRRGQLKDAYSDGVSTDSVTKIKSKKVSEKELDDYTRQFVEKKKKEKQMRMIILLALIGITIGVGIMLLS